MHWIKKISYRDLNGLYLYPRDEDKMIKNIEFKTPRIMKFLKKYDLPDYHNSKNYDMLADYYDGKYADITKNELKNLELDFETKETKIRLAFYNNYMEKNKIYFEIHLPIRLVDFLGKSFDHFNKVGLIGYPDDAGIDAIEYDEKHDIYLVYIWLVQHFIIYNIH